MNYSCKENTENIRIQVVNWHVIKANLTTCVCVCFREPPMCGSSLCSVTEESHYQHKKSVLVWLWISGSSLVFPRERSLLCCSSVSAAISGRRHASESTELHISFGICWSTDIIVNTIEAKIIVWKLCFYVDKMLFYSMFAGCSISTPSWWWALGVKSVSCPLQTAVQ